jgi:hypothetical protein
VAWPKNSEIGIGRRTWGIVYFGKIRKLFKIRKRKIEHYFPL